MDHGPAAALDQRDVLVHVQSAKILKCGVVHHMRPMLSIACTHHTHINLNFTRKTCKNISQIKFEIFFQAIQNPKYVRYVHKICKQVVALTLLKWTVAIVYSIEAEKDLRF